MVMGTVALAATRPEDVDACIVEAPEVLGPGIAFLIVVPFVATGPDRCTALEPPKLVLDPPRAAMIGVGPPAAPRLAWPPRRT